MKKGFTLIELLIVITIMAILAGAAVPYVQDYIEDARIAKAKEDLNEIRNAIMRYEVEQGKMFDPVKEINSGNAVEDLKNWQSLLVGPYLANTVVDPWGRAYKFSHAGSCVMSGAEDGDFNTNVISMDVRPAMAPTRAWWIDKNRNGLIDENDEIDIKFTRPIGALVNSDVTFIKKAGDPASDVENDNAVLVTDTHKKGLNWAKLTVKTTPLAAMVVGATVKVKASCTDTAVAMGSTDAGIYTSDQILQENIVDSATANPCNATLGCMLKAAQ